jgi:hypothetical protein
MGLAVLCVRRVSRLGGASMTPELFDLLVMLEDYFDNKADLIDGDYGIPEPNKEAWFQAKINEILDAQTEETR